jgi:large subunit ribosomal protein L1
MKLSKKRKVAASKVDATKIYSLEEASKLMKDINCTKFDSSVDLHIRLGVDPK